MVRRRLTEPDDNGDLPLHVAIKHGHADAVRANTTPPHCCATAPPHHPTTTPPHYHTAAIHHATTPPHYHTITSSQMGTILIMAEPPLSLSLSLSRCVCVCACARGQVELIIRTMRDKSIGGQIMARVPLHARTHTRARAHTRIHAHTRTRTHRSLPSATCGIPLTAMACTHASMNAAMQAAVKPYARNCMHMAMMSVRHEGALSWFALTSLQV